MALEKRKINGQWYRRVSKKLSRIEAQRLTSLMTSDRSVYGRTMKDTDGGYYVYMRMK